VKNKTAAHRSSFKLRRARGEELISYDKLSILRRHCCFSASRAQASVEACDPRLWTGEVGKCSQKVSEWERWQTGWRERCPQRARWSARRRPDLPRPGAKGTNAPYRLPFSAYRQETPIDRKLKLWFNRARQTKLRTELFRPMKSSALHKLLALTLTASGLLAQTAFALITIETVPVGNAGNTADPTTGYGAVGYDYGIGK